MSATKLFSNTTKQKGFWIYILLCILVSIPVLYNIHNFLYSNYFPAGGDPADHLYFIEKIFFSGNPLVYYSQFASDINAVEPSNIAIYYPSFFHVSVAVLARLVFLLQPFDFRILLDFYKIFLIGQYSIGLIGYAILIRKTIENVVGDNIKDKVTKSWKYNFTYHVIVLVAFSIVVYSSSPIIKTFRDGGYGEIFAIWTIFPFYLYALLSKKLKTAGLLLAIIAATHNLSFIIALGASVSFFLMKGIFGSFPKKKETLAFVVVFTIFFLPSFVFFYYPFIIAVITSSTGTSAPQGVDQFITRADIADQVTPLLYYLGTTSGVVLFVAEYRKLSWLPLWTGIFFITFGISIFANRFMRELSLPLGLSLGIIIALSLSSLIFKDYNLIKKLTGRKNKNGSTDKSEISMKNVLMCMGLSISLIFVFSFYFYDRVVLFSDGDIINYNSNNTANFNVYLKNLIKTGNPNDGRVLLVGVDPWLKPLAVNQFDVLELVPKDDELSISKFDREINSKLYGIIYQPNSKESMRTTKEFNIDHIVIIDPLPQRWYSDSFLELYNNMTRYYPDFGSNYISLDHVFSAENGEKIRLYTINLEYLRKYVNG